MPWLTNQQLGMLHEKFATLNFYNQSKYSERLRVVTEHGMYSVVETMTSFSIQLVEGHLRLMVTMLDCLHLLCPSKTMATSTMMK